MNRPLDLPRISIDLTREADFSIGTLRVQPSHRQVSANGHQETIQPRVMQVLVALARAEGSVLSRDHLVETCWDGLTVGDDAINRCIAKVRQVAELGGGPHFEIETVPRVGYRLAPINTETPDAVITPATPEMAAAGAPASEQTRDGKRAATQRYRTVAASALIGALIFALIGISMFWSFRPPQPRPSAPHRDPLLAVLPFRNLGGDADARYLSDGVTQEIIDALLQVTEIRVAAPGSSFAIRNAGVSQFAKSLAATHVLNGSVERHGSDLRVVAQLTDTDGNRAIWSHIYRTTVAQTPALQHNIAVQIANALDMRLSRQSLKEAVHVDPVAYDHYLRGRDLFRQRRDFAVAAEELDSALRLAPGLAKAWATLGAVRYLEGADPNITVNSAQKFEQARAAANRALALDPGSGEALGVLAMVSGQSMIVQDQLLERALRAEPNNTQLLNWHHNFMDSVGRIREANDEIERAYELDRLTPAIIYNATLDSLWRGNFERAKQIIALGVDYCSPAAVFELQVEYLLAIRDWKGLARKLSAISAGTDPQLAANYRLAAETSTAIANRQSDKFAALRARWRASAYSDHLFAVTFLTLFGDTGGALKAIDTASTGVLSPESQALFNPALPALRRDPAARGLMAKWGLFEYWRASNHWPDFCDEPGLPFNCKAEAQLRKT